jgi:hypothetical protein
MTEGEVNNRIELKRGDQRLKRYHCFGRSFSLDRTFISSKYKGLALQVELSVSKATAKGGGRPPFAVRFSLYPSPGIRIFAPQFQTFVTD